MRGCGQMENKVRGGLSVWTAPRCRKQEVCIISKHQEFDAPIFEAATEPVVDEAKLQERLAQYMELELFQMDIGDLISDYHAQRLPVPPMEQLREEAAAEARKCLEAMMICEAKGHLWKERDADPENGTSTLSCRRCGAEEHLRW